MKLKKSVFSYIIWAVFVFFCGTEMIRVLESAEVVKMLNLSFAAAAGAACGYLLLTVVVYFALRILCREIGAHIREKERFEKMASVVLPVMILIGAVAYLVLYVVYHAPLTLQDDSFYRQAVVSAEASVPFTVHGASWLYTSLLHIMLLIFGNTPFAGVVLQIVLFFVCLLLLYIGMQSYAGTLSAVVSMAALGFLPVSLQFVFSLTPELFYLALYLFGFCLAGSIFRRFAKEGGIYPSQYLSVFVLGVYIGFLTYLDIYGITLYLFFALLFSVDVRQTMHISDHSEEKQRASDISDDSADGFRGKRQTAGGIGKAFGVNLMALLGGTAGFALFSAAASFAGKMSVAAYLEALYSLYVPAGFQVKAALELLLLPDATLVGSLLLISFAFFTVPAFLIWKKSQNSAFILKLFLVCGMSAFSVFHLNMQMMATLSWGLLAGLGFYGVIRQPGVSAKRESESEKLVLVKESDKTGLSEERILEKKAETKSVENKNAAKKVQMKPMENMNAEIETTKKQEQQKTAPGKPLHNPLPVPKKKSRPQADFGHQVRDEDMKFDVEVAEDDDFDV